IRVFEKRLHALQSRVAGTSLAPRYAAIARSYAAWTAVDHRLAALSAHQKRAAATRLLNGGSNDLGDQVAGGLSELGDVATARSTAAADSSQQQGELLMGIIGFAALLLATGIGYAISRRLLGNVRQVLHA